MKQNQATCNPNWRLYNTSYSGKAGQIILGGEHNKTLGSCTVKSNVKKEDK